MKFSEMSRALFDRLSVRMQDLGFKARWSNADFVRKEPWGGSRVHLMMSIHPDGIGVSAEMVLRIDNVESTLARYYPDIEAKYLKEVPTLSIEFGNHLDDKPKIWVVRQEIDIPVCEDHIFDLVTSTALPFFERYNNVEEAYELLRSGKKGELYAPLNSRRGMRLIVMARLLGRAEDVPAIIESYRPLIERTESREASRFEQFLKLEGLC